MNGTGSDIWGTTDQFRFVYKQLTGNGSIVARVDHLDNTNEWAKAGVMIREKLDSDSMLVDGVLTPTFRACLQWRASRAADMGNPDTGSNTVANSFELPHWIKLTRNGNVFTVQHSTDGQTWLNIVPDTAGDPTSVTLAMSQTVYIGLAVCSHSDGVPAGAQFSQIAITGTVSSQWQSAAIGTEQIAGNGIDTFYVAVQDSAGKKATLINPNPYAVTLGEWTQWLIPLGDISAAGVDTKSIAKFYIGVGDRNLPSKNVSGLLYIDDIAYGHPLE
jgi:regulation of enolase protein 1 (concanavalin A-like superfamily)